MKASVSLFTIILFIFGCFNNVLAQNDNNAKARKNPRPTAKNTGVWEKVDTLNLSYFGFMCPCAQWIRDKDYMIFQESGYDGFPEEYHDSIFMHLMPSSCNTKYPVITDCELNLISHQVIGRYYKEKIYRGWEGEEHPEMAFQVISSKPLVQLDTGMISYSTFQEELDLNLVWDSNEERFVENEDFIQLSNNFSAYQDQLIELISNETITYSTVCSLDRNITFGGLVHVLIDQIQKIPYATVYQVQFCVLELDCLYPLHVIDYVEGNRVEVQEKLKQYLNEKQK